MEKTSSQDQCAPLDYAHDENCGKHTNDTKPALFMCDPSASQAEFNQPSTQIPYAYFDPYTSGLYAAYTPHTVIQPNSMGAVMGRVALSVDRPEDGPIYVNAKQYHGILRRRQMRAKLEAQNKLVKTRKPYLHESRHMHALNRVRGSGGRFLSTKKPRQPDSHPPSCSQSTGDLRHYNHNINSSNGDGRFEANKHNARPITEGTSVYQQQADSRFSSIPIHMAVSMHNGNQHFASIVR